MKLNALNLTLGIVSEVIDTKNGNNDYKVIVFDPTMVETDSEMTIIDYEAKVVPVSQAKVIEKSIKAGKIVKMNAVPRR